jgi:hypothetical protein
MLARITYPAWKIRDRSLPQGGETILAFCGLKTFIEVRRGIAKARGGGNRSLTIGF